MTFDLIKEPKNASNAEILFFEILKISHDDNSLTKDILEDKEAYKKFQQKIYSQFDRLEITAFPELPKTDHPDNIPEFCLCSRSGISFHCQIQNRYTKKHCWVGSMCVRKFLPHLCKDLNKKVSQYKNLQKGHICRYCETSLWDLRLCYQKDGYCDSKCYNKSKYIMPFGKYKGQILNELIYTNEGFDYITWVKEVIQHDKNAFCCHPLFLVIINDVKLELTEELTEE